MYIFVLVLKFNMSLLSDYISQQFSILGLGIVSCGVLFYLHILLSCILCDAYVIRTYYVHARCSAYYESYILSVVLASLSATSLSLVYNNNITITYLCR